MLNEASRDVLRKTCNCNLDRMTNRNWVWAYYNGLAKEDGFYFCIFAENILCQRWVYRLPRAARQD